MQMTVASAHSIERTVHKTNEWLKDLCEELGVDDRQEAWRILGGYLQVLRERLTVSEAAHLGAQFTHLVRGAYYEAFDPDRQPELIRDRDVFCDVLRQTADLPDRERAAAVAVICTDVMRRHVAAGEVDDVLAQLPREIAGLLAGR
jgi:uncharacterized protein (DUF2267 family)